MFRFSPHRSWVAVVGIPVFGAVIGLLGPFGTYVSMTAFERMAHFALCFTLTGLLAIEGSYRVARHWFQGRWPLWAALVLDLAFVPVSAGLVWASLRLIAPEVLVYVSFPELMGQNLLVFALIRTGIVMAALWRETRLGAAQGAPSKVTAPEAEDPIRTRLPFALKGAEILAVSAEDHYLRVYTSRGEALIHLSLSEAVEDREGFQIHRSHWISGRAVKDIDDTRVHLLTGPSFPLSRHRRKAFGEWLAQAGVMPA